MAKRILQIIPTLQPTGAGRQLILLAQQLPRDQFEVHVCALDRGGLLEQDLLDAQIPTTVIGKRAWSDPLAFRRMKGYLTGLRPDLVHTWLLPANRYGFALARLCGTGHIIASERTSDTHRNWLAWAIDRHIARSADHYVVDTPTLRDYFAAQRFPAAKIEVIPNAVAPPRPSASTRRQLLAELGLPAGSRLIGVVSQLLPVNRLKDAIWAADLLKVIRDDVYLLVIGDGPQRDRLHKFCDQCRVRDKVLFLGQRRDLARLLPHFDVFWSTGQAEGQPLSLMEAMMAARPVVATDIASHLSLVTHDQSGFLFPVGDRASLTRWTNQLLDDPALAERLGQGAQARIQREFALDQMVQQHADLYRRVLGCD